MAVKYLVGIDFGHGETMASCYDIDSKGIIRLNIRKDTEDKGRKQCSVVYRKLKGDGSYDYRIDEGGVGYAPYISFKDKPSILNDTKNEREKRSFSQLYKTHIRKN